MTHTKDEALRMALEALKRMKSYGNTFAYRKTEQNPHEQVCEALTAIKQALALDKMAENARELGLDYEPAPVQPVAWLYPEGLEALKAGKCWTAYGTKQDDNCNILVYLAAVAQKVEPVKTECDGFDSHPAAPVQQEPVTWLEDLKRLASICPELNMVNYSEEDVDDLNCWAIEVATCIDSITTPTAAQRKPVDLTNDEINNIANGCHLGKSVQGAICEALDKYKEKNT